MSSLNQSLDGSQMLLRNYSADPVAGYEWRGGTLVAGPVKTHTLAMFTTRSVKFKHGKVVFQGDRQTLIVDTETNQPALVGHTPMKLEVDLRHANPRIVLPRLQEMMFFPDATAAVSGLPEWVAGKLPIARRATCYLVQSEDDCPSSYLEDGLWNRMERHDPKFSPPRMISSGVPKHSDPVRWTQGLPGPLTAGFPPAHGPSSGAIGDTPIGPSLDTMPDTLGSRMPTYQSSIMGPDVSETIILALISETGQTVDLWLALPRVRGDMDAGPSFRSQVFSPALYDGRPVGFVLTNFSSLPGSAK